LSGNLRLKKKDFGLSKKVSAQNPAQEKSVSHKVLRYQYLSQHSVQEESISRKFEFSEKIKGCQRELDAMMRSSNMGILPDWLKN